MKLLIIKGSYHKNGFIASLVEQVVAGFKAHNSSNEIKIIDLLEAKIDFCTGCKGCGRNNLNEKMGRCVIDDNMPQILEEMINADRLVLASPVYCLGVTALMKRFVERTTPLTYYPENSWPRARFKANRKKRGGVILSTDCPYPFNKIFFLTLYPNLLLKFLLKMAGFGRYKTIAASTVQNKFFAKKAYNLGRYLAKE